MIIDRAKGEALGAVDTALAALAVRPARESDEAPTAALAQRLRETLGALAENRQTQKQKGADDFIASDTYRAVTSAGVTAEWLGTQNGAFLWFRTASRVVNPAAPRMLDVPTTA